MKEGCWSSSGKDFLKFKETLIKCGCSFPLDVADAVCLNVLPAVPTVTVQRGGQRTKQHTADGGAEKGKESAFLITSSGTKSTNKQHSWINLRLPKRSCQDRIQCARIFIKEMRELVEPSACNAALNLRKGKKREGWMEGPRLSGASKSSPLPEGFHISRNRLAFVSRPHSVAAGSARGKLHFCAHAERIFRAQHQTLLVGLVLCS